MFNFFTDIKNRLTALEQHVETIYAHLHKHDEVVTPVEQPVAMEVKNDAA